ncbi:hypothetical protein GOV08_03115 [Candidatus Woesearchaeota archaeon]|nr:hypothetical protein [Candidatus Woesearchaeota archaeon]
MNPNSLILKEFFDKVLSVGSEIASKKFVLFVLKNLIEEQKSEHSFMQYISVNADVHIDPKIDIYSKEELAEPINKIFDYLFLDTSKKMLRDSIDSAMYGEFKTFGLDV